MHHGQMRLRRVVLSHGCGDYVVGFCFVGLL